MRTRLCAVAAFALVLSGCGAKTADSGAPATEPTETTTTTTTPTVASEPPTTEGTAGDKCTADDLTGVVQPGDAAAGNRYVSLVVTNTSDQTCSLYGYGGLQLIGANGQPNPTILTRQPDPGPASVSLVPGGKATKKLHWVVVPTGNEPQEGPCQPESTGATVIPPDDTTSFSVDFDFGSVCNGGTIEGSAYFAG
jgi:uncharacterized protein DUF4232